MNMAALRYTFVIRACVSKTHEYIPVAPSSRP